MQGFSGRLAYHGFRLPVPGLWLDVFQKIKSMGFTGVSFYVDWALLEGEQGVFRADGIFALDGFFQAASDAGIYLLAVSLRTLHILQPLLTSSLVTVASWALYQCRSIRRWLSRLVTTYSGSSTNYRSKFSERNTAVSETNAREAHVELRLV